MLVMAINDQVGWRLPPEVAQWVRVRAAERKVRPSDVIEELVREQMGATSGQSMTFLRSPAEVPGG